MIGTKLAHYEITLHLGSGGMGDVYQATDSKLGRSVAIKLLPEAFSRDGERSARFEREARLLASLNHPNIAAIYGLDQADGRNLLVMELVSGETLAQQIAKGRVPLDEAVPIALQIAEGLESAHEAGIVHRDLKPANIKVTPEGRVKILDFGLAKAFEEPGDMKLSNSPTLMSASVPGMILGTAAYMSPEQTKGRNADRRADIWAFGCVLFEMLSGTSVFDGDTVSEVFAGILRGDPDWSRLPSETPPALKRLLRRCLAKDPAFRMQSIGDVRLDLAESLKEELPAPVMGASRSRSEKLAWAAVAVLAVAVAVVGVVARNAMKREPAPIVRFEVAPPDGRSFSGSPSRFAVSPNGRYIVFPVDATGGQPNQLWLRRLDSLESRPIPGTESAPGDADPQAPFWSPDSRTIGFFTANSIGTNASSGSSKLKRVDVDGGPVQTLCELPSNQAAGTWNADGVILVSTIRTGGVMRVAATGGVPVAVTSVDTSQESSHLWPRFLPDGRHFLYQVEKTDHSRAVFVGSIDSKERTQVVQSEYMAQFVSPDILLYLKDDTLLAQTMNLKTFALTGEPALVTKGVVSATNGRPGFSVSNSGVLAYTAGSASSEVAGFRMTWLDRKGIQSPLGPPVDARNISLSLDGKHVASQEGGGAGQQPDIWIYDIARGARTRLTSSPNYETAPLISPDGNKVLFASTPGLSSPAGLFVIPANGAASAQVVLPPEPGMTMLPLDWSRDGRLVLFRKSKLGYRNGDLWTLALDTNKATAYLEGPFMKQRAAFSPDGHWVAYDSDDSGSPQVFIQPFPNAAGGKTQISTDGGSSPRWRPDGHELFYLDAQGRLMAVPMALEHSLTTGKPVLLAETGSKITPGGTFPPFAVDHDGQRFLFSLPAALSQGAPLTVTLNWNSALK